jgi:hypothetical protein
MYIFDVLLNVSTRMHVSHSHDSFNILGVMYVSEGLF